MAAKIDWYYHRNGCQTCQKADRYLEQQKFEINEQVDARKQRISPTEAVRLARSVDKLWVARGKGMLFFDMKQEPPSDSELKKLLIGPSGNLRAPTIRRGKSMLVGFHSDAYGEGLGK